MMAFLHERHTTKANMLHIHASSYISSKFDTFADDDIQRLEARIVSWIYHIHWWQTGGLCNTNVSVTTSRRKLFLIFECLFVQWENHSFCKTLIVKIYPNSKSNRRIYIFYDTVTCKMSHFSWLKNIRICKRREPWYYWLCGPVI